MLALVWVSIVLLFEQSSNAMDWAVVVSGSSSYINYRHQSDVCHAYQLLRNAGMRDENIIMMYYDDIANNIDNPFKGKIFNRPTLDGTPGVDVYHGCKKDYVGYQVTASNFLHVITGNSTAMEGIGSGKVLQSGPEDHVFINFVDHGGTGILAFPTGPYLYAHDLMAALQTMYNRSMYAKLVIYVEACESGSMFSGGLLPLDLEIYATTASNPMESSWGTFCPPQDYVNGIELNTCLGDAYSVHWMYDADRMGRTKRNQSLQEQYIVTRDETTRSHVMQYGNQTWTNLPIFDFQGNQNTMDQSVGIHASPSINTEKSQGWFQGEQVDSRNMELYLAKNQYERTMKKHNQAWEHLLAVQGRQRIVDLTFAFLVDSCVGRSNYQDLYVKDLQLPPVECMRHSIELYERHCGRLSDYGLKYVRTIVNLCKQVPWEKLFKSIVRNPHCQ